MLPLMRVLKKLKISTIMSEDRGLMLQLNLHTKSAKKIVSYVGKQAYFEHEKRGRGM